MMAQKLDGPLPIYDQRPMIGGQPHRKSAFTVPFSLSGHPVVGVPIGLTRDDLPIGLQIVGQRRHDADLIAIAMALSHPRNSKLRRLGGKVAKPHYLLGFLCTIANTELSSSLCCLQLQTQIWNLTALPYRKPARRSLIRTSASRIMPLINASQVGIS